MRRILAVYFVIAGLYTLAAALIWGVNTLFLLDSGLDIFDAFLANAAFTAGAFLFEIPTGVFADTRGRRASFLLSVAILFGSTLGYVGVARIGGGLVAFSAVSLVMGLGFTFYSGAVEAWLVDALQHAGYKGSLDRVFARGAMVTGAAMLVGTVTGGFLGSVDLSLPYLVRAGLLVAVFAVALATMHDRGFAARPARLSEFPAQMRRVTEESISFGWRRRSVRLLMICGLIQFGFLSWSFYAWQPYFLELLQRDAAWISGLIAAAVALSMIAGNVLVDWLSRFCGKRTTLILWAAGLQTVAAVGVGLAGSFWLAVGLYLLVTAAMGVSGPVKQAYIHQVIPSERRASVVSFSSMFASAGGILGQSGLGYLSRSRSIADGFVVGGLLTVLAFPVLIRLRGLRESADRIVGTRCGTRGPCAAQGVPEISQVDASSRAGA